MDILTLPNLTNYTIQLAVVVALATLVGWLLRIDTPAVRYSYWRVVFVLCLMLPLLQGRATPEAIEVTAEITAVPTVAAAVTGPSTLAAAGVDPWQFVLPALAAGAALRLIWLTLCFIRLQRLRRAGVEAPYTAMHQELQDWIGVRPEIRYVASLRQPVTFGLLRPVILLPASLAEHREEIQRAVLSHELFHVKRRDWGWLLVEEFACALLWFNPAVWWLVSRVHLAREVVVDELAVLATGRRRTYVEALMAFADETSLAPVAAFGGRPQLFNRIVLLSKEVGMSSRRLVFTCAVALAVIAPGTWRVTSAFPLTAAAAAPQTARQETPGPIEQRAKPITPENPVPRRTMYEAPEYPVEARVANARGTVTVMLTLDELGRVAEVRRLALSVATPTANAQFNNARREDMERLLIKNSPADADTLRAAAWAMEEAAFRAVERWRYEAPASGPLAFPMIVTFSPDGEVVTARGRGASGGSGGAVGGRTLVSGGIQAPPGTVRVGGNIKTPTKIKDVRPVYPDVAQAARVSGLVILEVLVGPEGIVQDARVLRSIPLLDQAAIDAVTQWRFTPTLMNGVPIPVLMTVTVNFTLQEHVHETPREVEPEPLRAAARAGIPGRRAPVLIRDVKPQYTPEAMRAGIEGTVEVEAVIGTDGTVTSARVVKGLPMLDEQAIAAVQQWQFQPIPEPYTTTIELTFSLRK